MIWLYMAGIITGWIITAKLWASMGFVDYDRQILKERKEKDANSSK